MVALGLLATWPVLTSAPAAEALFSAQATGGPQADSTASLAPPAGLSVKSASCTFLVVWQMQVTLSWQGSSSLDADGAYEVQYYAVKRSVNGAAYTQVGSTTGAPPATTFTDDASGLSLSGCPARVSYEVQAAQTQQGGGWRSAYSTVSVSFG